MRLLGIVLLVFLLTTCTKFGKNISVEGRVVNPVTGEGVPNVEVWLRKSSSGIPGGYKKIKTVTTDANGYFEFDKLVLKSANMIVNTDGNVFYDLGWLRDNGTYLYGMQGIDKGEKMVAEYHTVPYAYSKLIISNDNCLGSTDSLTLYRSNQINSIDGTYAWVHTGCVYWETNGYSDIPMGNVYYTWIVKRNGISTTYHDTVFYNAGEYKTYTISY